MADDGYVVWCKGCSFYQLAFGSTTLTLAKNDLRNLAEVIKYKCSVADSPNCPHGKTIILPTAHEGIYKLIFY